MRGSHSWSTLKWDRTLRQLDLYESVPRWAIVRAFPLALHLHALLWRGVAEAVVIRRQAGFAFSNKTLIRTAASL